MTELVETFDKDGKPIKDAIIPDGGKMRVHMTLMDSASPELAAILRDTMTDVQRPQAAMHRPGSAVLTDADRAARQKALDARDKRLVDAWKSPPALQAAVTDATQRTTPAGGSAADRRDARLRDAWKMGAR